MTAPKTEPGTGVATSVPRSAVAERIAQNVAHNRERNALIAAIRGTMWGRDTTPEQARYVAQYCRDNNLDAVRHVELLGGKIYLNTSLYDEKGAYLIRSGAVCPEDPDYINVDERLDALALKGDAWAIEESTRRLRLRIQYAVPEKSVAAVLQKFLIPASGKTIVGVNWCGGNGRRDPVGDAEPAKTAQTRARRRCWIQIADVIPGYADVVRPLEANAKLVSERIPVTVVDAPAPKPEPQMAQRVLVSRTPIDSAHTPTTEERDPSWDVDDDEPATVEGELPLGELAPVRRGVDALREP